MSITRSIVGYLNRGPWGNSSYPGNTTGYLIRDLIETYKPSFVLDPMGGSGTTRDVCQEMGIDCLTYDLANGEDILDPGTFGRSAFLGSVDLIFWHPPYWNMIRYSQDARDFSSCVSYELYLAKMQRALLNLKEMLNDGNGRERARIAILMGDLRRNGHYYWISRDLFTAEKLRAAGLVIDAQVIKVQNYVKSGNRVYAPDPKTGPLIRIAHETVTILRHA